jgi:hypothetical protein
MEISLQVVENKSSFGLVEGFNNFLENVVAMVVHSQAVDVVVTLQSFLNYFELSLFTDRLNYSLQGISSFVISRHSNKIVSLQLLKHLNSLLTL